MGKTLDEIEERAWRAGYAAGAADALEPSLIRLLIHDTNRLAKALIVNTTASVSEPVLEQAADPPAIEF